MKRLISYVSTVVAVGAVIYHMVQVVHPLQAPQLHENTHLVLALSMVYLTSLVASQRRWPLDLALLILAIATTTYIHVNYLDLQMNAGFPTPVDTVVGVIIIVVVMDACRRAMGWAIPTLVLIFMGYAYFGHYFPGPLHTPELTVIGIIADVTTNLHGVYGELLSISAVFIFLFVVMGGIIQVTAASRFFASIGSLAARLMQGGPAMSAVIGSALLGTTVGATSANVAVTGAFTIPMMKKMGYAPHQAGAIESAASNGGQIMPPVMGSVAFIMSNFTGIPYFTIAIASFIPALLYYISVGLYVQFTAKKKGLMPPQTRFGAAELKELMITAPAFIMPLVVIVFLFLQGFSPMFVAFWAVITVIAFGLIMPGKRPSLKEWVGGFAHGAQAGATIGVALACVGIVVQMLIVTGLAIKLPGLVESWSHGNLGLALVLVALSCLILGMGMPTAPAYIIVAIAAAPVLVKMGVPLLATHLFVLYFATISLITPPVAGGVVVACRLAGSGYMRTGFEATKVAVVGFLAPFIFVRSPIYLLQPGGALIWDITTIIAGLVMIVSAQAGFVGYYLTTLRTWEKTLTLICALVMFVYIVALPYYSLLAAGLALFLVLSLIQVQRRSKRLKALAAVQT